MDLELLRNVLDSNNTSSNKEKLILQVLSKDKNVIPLLLNILENERLMNEELNSEMNLLLSKAHTVMEHPKLNTDKFVQVEIIDFYKKYKGVVGHCFKKLF